MRVTNDMLLGCPLPLTVVAVNYVAMLKAFDHELCHPLMASPHNTMNYVAILKVLLFEHESSTDHELCHPTDDVTQY
jgi:hypothetical protein